MRIAELAGQSGQNLSLEPEARRLSVVVADGSSKYLDTIYAVEEFHEIVDLVGRATNFEETIELALSLRPDLVLMDIEMPAADLAVRAILLSRPGTKIVGVSAGDSIPLETPTLILSFSALLHQSRLRQEFVPALDALYSYPATFGPLPVRPSLRQPPPPQVRTPCPKLEVNDSKEDR
jgi:DNA-binding NarL/FixJ family response regulator